MTAPTYERVPATTWRKRMRQQSMLFASFDRVIRNPQGVIAIAGLLLLVALAIGAGLVTKYGATSQSYPGAARFLAPSLDHPFGTDELRRDLFSRTVFGLRSSLIISVSAVSIGATAGISAGFIAGYAGGWTERIVMRVVDSLLAFPGLLAALAILTILGPGTRNVGIAIAFFNIPAFCRLSRAQMLSEKNKDYVSASQALGAGPLRIIFGHIARNALPPLLTQVSLAMNGAVLISASLSFLGLGDKPPTPSLGGLLNSSKSNLRDAWWYAVCPGAVLAFLLLCLNFLADAVNEATSPYSQRKV
jgi:peptide/nickel transport system permease protein